MPSDPRPQERLVDPEAILRFRLANVGEPCQICERRTGTDPHHVTFRSQGGDDESSNLLWLCRICHDGIHNGRLPRYPDG